LTAGPGRKSSSGETVRKEDWRKGGSGGGAVRGGTHKNAMDPPMPSIVWNFAETSTVILPAAGVLSLNSTKMGGPRGARGATVGMSSCLVLAAPPPDAVAPGAAAGPGLTPPSAAGSALARESFRKRRMLVEDGSACRGRGSGARGLAARRASDS
jgi:hypothetical protein